MASHHWRKSSYSTSNGGNCLEARRLAGRHDIRDSKNPAAGIITITPTTWQAFLAGITTGKL